MQLNNNDTMSTLAQRIDDFHNEKSHTPIERAIFENSIDCLIYGYGFNTVNIYDYETDNAKEIYRQAKNFLSNN